MTKHNLFKLWVVLLFLLPALQVTGQEPGKLRFSYLTPEDGLSQSSVYSILQDSAGYMWFATQDGLNKYNGYEFTTYYHDPEDPYSISLSEIRSLYEDSKGNLWIGTLGGGINLYDRQGDRFIRFKGDVDQPQQTLSDNSIWAIYEDSRGNFWIGTSWGLNLMEREGERDENYLSKVTHYTKHNDDPKSISSNQVTAIYEDSRENLWIGTEDGLNIFNRETESFIRFMHDPQDPGSIGHNHITTIYEDHTGRLWIGTEGGGLNYYDYEDKEFDRYQPQQDNSNSIAGNTIYAIQEDNKGLLWVGTGNYGLSLFDRSDNDFHNYQYNQNDPHSINNNGINSIYAGDDQMWVGTFAGGVNFTEKRDPQIYHYTNDPNRSSSLSHNSVRSFLETSNGKILIGTDGGGLNIFDRKKEQFSTLKHKPGDTNGIPSNVILDMKKHPRDDNSIWLGTYNSGLSLFNIENETFRNYQHDPSDSSSLSKNDIFELYVDQQNRLWIGTNGGGVNMLRPESEEFVRYMQDTDDSTTIDNDDIRSFYEDSRGNFWIGTYGGRLTKLDRKTEEFESFNIDTGNLYSSVIHSMHEDSENNFWLGTRGGGLKLFDRTTHNVTTYSKEQGLPSNIVNGILEDDHGNLWISTNNGISKFDFDSETLTNFGLEDELQSLEFNEGAYFKDSDGYMYFGGVNGFNRFHPDSVKLDQEVAPVVLTDFKMFNKSVSVGDDSPLDKHISQTDRLVLSHDASILTFDYVALDFNPQKGIQYAYKLEGFDDEWNYVGGQRSATYTNLDPGEYKFKLKAANNFEVWGEETEMLTLVIPPPFWQTYWFYFFASLFLVGGVVLTYQYRVHKIQERNRILEKQVAARTSELKQKNEDLESALKELKETRSTLMQKAHKAGMADLATGVLHNIGNILNSVNISTTVLNETIRSSKVPNFLQANKLLDNHKDNMKDFLFEDPRGMKLLHYYLRLSDPMGKEYEKLKAHCNRLSEKVQLMLEVIDAQQDFAKVGRISEKVQLEQIVEDTLTLQAGSIERHDLDIEKKFANTDMVKVQKSKLIHILINLISNAKEAMEIKDIGEKKITIRTRQEEDKVYLSISDQGTGIEDKNLNKIFNHGFTTKKKGHGYGLHTCANYMTEMGGEIMVKSEGKDKGATFILSFPNGE